MFRIAKHLTQTATLATVMAIAAAATLSIVPASEAAAQAYPSKPIRVVVPYPPGSTDLVVRAVADELRKTWSQPLVIDNKPGASAIIGSELVAKAPPDGYTLLATTDSPITSNPFLFTRLPFDPMKDLVPVTQLLVSNMLVVANPSFPAKNLKELVALARSRPGKLTYASWGEGSQAYLVFETLRREAGIEIVEVPYKGLVPATVAALSGEVDFTLSTPAVTLGHLAAGKLAPIAITRRVALPGLANVPSFEEQGYPGLDPGAWMGIFAPAGTPPEIVAKIQHDIAQALKDPELRARQFESKGVFAGGQTPAEFAGLVRNDFTRKQGMYRTLGIQPK